ncbi:hypothetical protein D3C87_1992580 [compost metagenome]
MEIVIVSVGYRHIKAHILKYFLHRIFQFIITGIEKALEVSVSVERFLIGSYLLFQLCLFFDVRSFLLLVMVLIINDIFIYPCRGSGITSKFGLIEGNNVT